MAVGRFVKRGDERRSLRVLDGDGHAAGPNSPGIAPNSGQLRRRGRTCSAFAVTAASSVMALITPRRDPG